MAEREPTAQDAQLADILRTVEANPETRGALHELIHKVNPQDAERYLPDVAVKQAAKPILDEIRAERAALAADKQKQEQEKAAAQWQAKLAQAGFRPDQFKEATELAHSRGIADPETLKMRYDADRQVADPRTSRRSLIMPGAAGSGDWFEKGAYGGPGITQDWEAWRREAVDKMVSDWSAGKR